MRILFGLVFGLLRLRELRPIMAGNMLLQTFTMRRRHKFGRPFKANDLRRTGRCMSTNGQSVESCPWRFE
jgi:hypothetical protein